MDDKKIYKFKGTVEKCIYNTPDYKIYALNVDKFEYPDIKLNKYGNISLMGNMHDLVPDVEYEITAVEQESKYGIGYKLLNIKRDLPTTKESTYAFLSEILTENQANVLIDAYPDIIQKIKNNNLDDIDLSKLKGIGEKTFEKIRTKIVENFCLMDLVIEFKNVLSISMIKKIYDKYSSVEKIKVKLKEEPYTTLTKISGIGFKTADTIVLKLQEEKVIDFGYDVKTSADRCLACIIYLLSENENNGNTKANLTEIRKECLKLTPDCFEHFIDVIKDISIYYDKDTMDIALRKTYNTEVYIAKSIKYGLSIDNKWDYDWKQYQNKGEFLLSDEQVELLHSVCENNVVILTGGAGCVDCDTEFFNGYEWKRIADYNQNDKVLQYNEDGTAELVYPNAYIKNKADYLWHFETKNGLDQCLSSNHMVYYETRWGVRRKLKFSEVKNIQENRGFTGKFLTSFKYSGAGINLTDNEIRLMVAVFADGCYINNKQGNYVRIHIKKERKINRLTSLLKQMNIKYTFSKTKDGYANFHFHTPFNSKHFPKEWYNCSYEQLCVIADEVMYWDGSFSSGERYFTSNKDDADFIQFVFSSVGYKAVIRVEDRVGEDKVINGKHYVRHSVLYVVTRSKINKISMSVETRDSRNFGKTQIEQYKTIDGYEYCFNVPSHLLILRRNNKIFITGNCGKSASVQKLINMLDDNNKSYVLSTPTGKSSKVLSDFTNKNAKTIHRVLGFNPSTGWAYGKDNKIDTDVFLIDEFSMVSVELMTRVIDAIDFNKTRLVMIGDPNQLPSVQCGNLLHDFLASKIIPVIKLTKVFRYGTGGILTAATDIINCNKYIPNNNSKIASIGTDNGYMFIKSDDNTIIKDATTLYKKLITTGANGCVYKPEEIAVLTAYNKGDYGATELNKRLQEIANKNYGSNNCFKHGSSVYYLDDIVMQRVNNYAMEIYGDFGDEDSDAFCANGECSKITLINKDFMVCDYDDIRIKYHKEEVSELSLAYSYTIHRSQGSTIKAVIVISPRSHIYMSSANLLYVAVTRASDKCFHLGLPSTINMAIKKKENFKRSTFIQELLKS